MTSPTSRLRARLRSPFSRAAGAEQFDALYQGGRRELLLQAFVLTGDIPAATHAVRDAYVAARHHWDKVSRLEEPEEWIRPRAWAGAQRRHAAHPWHREKSLTPEQVTVLEAVHELPDLDRRVLLLDVLARLPLADLAREVAIPRDRAERLLAMARAGTAVTLGIDPSRLEERLRLLEGALAGTRLPRPVTVRRNGVSRRRTHAVVSAVVLVALALGAGAFVLAEPGEEPANLGPLVPRSMLLGVDQVRLLAPAAAWQHAGTSDNTTGSGLHSLCQREIFADEKGAGAWVRIFSTPGKPARSVTETVEISKSADAAKQAYDTTVGWFAGCGRARLLDAYTLTGVGDKAQALLLHVPGKPVRNYFVGIARTGDLTVSTLVETREGRSPRPRLLMRVLADAVQKLCASRVGGACAATPDIAPVLPPSSGEGAGLLAVADLPPVPGIRQPWAGTRPQVPVGPIASTTCDRTDFTGRGAKGPLSRTFLIPQAKLPPRFGITETIGRLADERAARVFYDRIPKRLAACEDEQLSTSITAEHLEKDGFRGSQFALWRVENEVNSERTVVFWMGVARVGTYVAQVQFAPADGHDIDEETFRALVTRARDRLFELVPAASPTPSPSAPAGT